MILSVHQPQYLPWLGYFDKVAASDLFVFLDEPQYKKREFQNRNRIKGPTGEVWLAVPCLSKGKFDQPIKDVEIVVLEKRARTGDEFYVAEAIVRATATGRPLAARGLAGIGS